MSLISILKEAEKISLTREDLSKMMGITTNRIIPYEDLAQHKNLESLFHPFGGFVINYRTSVSSGHWTLIFKKDDHIEFFDSFGLKPDEELQLTDFHIRFHQGKNIPHLTALLDRQDLKIVFNNVQLQNNLEDDNTCGRHIITRWLLRGFSLKKYQQLFTSKENKFNSDIWVTALTYLM